VTPPPQADDRYGPDVLANFSKRTVAAPPRVVEAVSGLVVEDVASDFCGAVTRIEGRLVELEDRRGSRRMFHLGAGFLLDGEAVALRAPRAAAPTGLLRTASGSIAAPEQRARVARASRIFVEGRHDAELVEKVWGSDLRIEGVVVEYIDGVDNLADVLAEFRPSAERRAGVLVDHLIPGSKESRVADAIAAGRHGAFVSVVGHPFVDVWQSVKPARLGLDAWPIVPRTIEWKHGICEALGWPHHDQADIAAAWQRILAKVSTYADLEPALLGRVEQLIDFVTDPAN
jgi:hypothetical protein